ncbi:MAG TPA: protein-disulfide reductase DsbD family protein [Candidatus Paceibacterota bacterium]|nr:protein-disulfide reductase DsbD family protein [Verrucomicrobiota bacterium]HSA11212.1 protein-disulfide reductase DsbD family protein [Candidatus Paceibacterota bacterium]
MLTVIGTAWFCLAGLEAFAAHTQARLLLAATTAKPGETVMAGVQLRMDPRWHTYWRNPGASGMATKIEWQLPTGITPGAVQWPVPEKLPDEDLTTYVYSNEVVLLVPLKLAPDLSSGSLHLKANVSWLECEVQCVPGKATVQATLNVGAEAKPSSDSPLIHHWQAKLPGTGDSLSAQAWWENDGATDSRNLILEWHSTSATGDADFFPYASEEFEVQPATMRLPAEPGKIRLRKEVRKLEGDWPRQISGLLIQQSGPAREAYDVNLPVQASSNSAAASLSQPSVLDLSATSLWKMLLYAFLGGLILNVMPCVLPVIALKILGFVGQAKDDPRRVRRLGLIYALGVLVSFLVLAGLIIGVKAAGHKAGWGMQFGNPQFLVLLTTLVTLVALNLFGLFEINPGARLLDAAGTLASKGGSAGAFFNGVLATMLATPCTAPFLGAALGFAFAQSPAIIVLMFAVVSFGLAAPYVILSWQPAWLQFLPKPGAWMERFKVAMGFPMLATAVWLFSLIPLHYGRRSLWLGLFLVVLALATWVYGQFVQRGRTHRTLGLVVALALVTGGYLYAVEGQLRWRSPVAEAALPGSLKESPDGIDWQRWSPAAVARARAEGRPVLVDFTADWCLTCQANKRVALDIPSVRAKLKEINALALLGDYTRLPDDITTELNRFGRAGVPLVLVYPRNSGEPPQVLPEALTPTIVLNALDRAAR